MKSIEAETQTENISEFMRKTDPSDWPLLPVYQGETFSSGADEARKKLDEYNGNFKKVAGEFTDKYVRNNKTIPEDELKSLVELYNDLLRRIDLFNADCNANRNSY